jgi:hypothetical protein
MRRLVVFMAGLFGLASAALLVAAQMPTPPQADIANGRIRTSLYLPDAQHGYYRATRFDWSGVISRLEWNGHNYFGQWFSKYEPTINDAITGPVEEFMVSPGYDDAKPGETFVRIGVGALRKPDEPAFRRFSTYQIVDHGKWTTNVRKDSVEFVHTLGDTAGYAYVYRKEVRLDGDALVLEHRLRNTGRKPMTTSVYNHNFFMLDGQPTGPDVVLSLPFEPRAVVDLAPAGLAAVRGRDFVYLKELQPKQTVQTDLTGFGTTSRDYDIRIENRRTGAGVRITSDRPVSRLLLWSPRTTVCPEPYIDLNVAPGRDVSWRIRYDFYQVARPQG